MKLSDLRVAAKLRAVLAIVAALAIALVAVALNGASRLDAGTTSIQEDGVKELQDVITFQVSFATERILIRDHLLSLDADDMAAIEQKLAAEDESMLAIIDQITAGETDPNLIALDGEVTTWLERRDSEVLPASGRATTRRRSTRRSSWPPTSVPRSRRRSTSASPTSTTASTPS